MHQTSYDNMLRFKAKFLSGKVGKKLLIYDIGSCDVNGSYKQIFDDPSWAYVGVDVAKGNNVDIVIDNLYSWKRIGSNTVDVVISGQAFEHMEYPSLAMLEIERILKPEGLCCIIAPSGGPDHKYPIDCWRFHPDGFASLANLANLEVLEVYAQWDTSSPTYSSWQDCVLIGRKNSCSLLTNTRRYLARKMLYESIKKLTGRTFLV